MTLKITPAWLILVVLLYMLTLVGICTLLLWWLAAQPLPVEGRPLRTAPPAADHPPDRGAAGRRGLRNPTA